MVVAVLEVGRSRRIPHGSQQGSEHRRVRAGTGVGFCSTTGDSRCRSPCRTDAVLKVTAVPSSTTRLHPRGPDPPVLSMGRVLVKAGNASPTDNWLIGI